MSQLSQQRTFFEPAQRSGLAVRRSEVRVLAPRPKPLAPLLQVAHGLDRRPWQLDRPPLGPVRRRPPEPLLDPQHRAQLVLVVIPAVDWRALPQPLA